MQSVLFTSWYMLSAGMYLTTVGHQSRSHVELFNAVGGGRRRLMAYQEGAVSDEEREMAEWVARGKRKELTWEEDLQR